MDELENLNKWQNGRENQEKYDFPKTLDKHPPESDSILKVTKKNTNQILLFAFCIAYCLFSV